MVVVVRIVRVVVVIVVVVGVIFIKIMITIRLWWCVVEVQVLIKRVNIEGNRDGRFMWAKVARNSRLGQHEENGASEERHESTD